jgi:tetratricopeptide (TPR) repeat protein
LIALAGSEELNMDRRGRAHILVGLAEVKLKRGLLTEAEDYLRRASEAAEATGERIVLAEVRVLRAQLEERNGNRALADDNFKTAIRILEELGMPDRLRDAHMAYAELLDARQDVAAASRHWKQAAEIGVLAALGLSWVGAPAGAEAKGSLA